MCGLGKNNKVVKSNIKLINDLKKVSLVSGKKKRIFFKKIFFTIINFNKKFIIF